MTMLQANNISFSIQGTSILRNVSLEVNPGEIVALLGQNGSGKTTFIELLCNMMKCSSGNFAFFGKGNFDQNKQNIGVLLKIFLQITSLIIGSRSAVGSSRINNDGLCNTDKKMATLFLSPFES
mgnify:CR=1 FL=1